MKRFIPLVLVLAACDPPPKVAGPPPEVPANTADKEPELHPANRLAKEKSPYLLQHAHNPVDWFPWGEEAFAKAKTEDKPIFLSVGYSTCHWCHVMERESFENEEIAKLLNDSFVAIKVDREERPDVDEIYMEAVQAMNDGSGGWPMSVFMTSDGKPFFAGTYFPPKDWRGRAGFGSLLTRIAGLWKSDRAELEKHGQLMVDHLASEKTSAAPGEVDEALFTNAVRSMVQRYDDEFGGFGNAPKFPPGMSLAFLLREGTADKSAMKALPHTLEAMAQGGIYDQVGGGFARYSTDQQWLVPHFEKMLYDNALLGRVYAETYAAGHNGYYSRVAREVFDYVLKEMTAPEGAFWCATDADSEGEEGKFFVWTPVEIEAVLGKEEAEAFCRYYGVTAAGNFEHSTSILHVDAYDETMEKRFVSAKAKLYAVRAKRIPPHLDDKMLVSWNGMMIGALATASGYLEEPRYRDAAARAADFLLRTCIVDGRLRRGYRQGVMSVTGFLDDHAYLAAGLLDLYEATGDLRWFRAARSLATEMIRLFEDTDAGAFFTSGTDQEKLITRRKDAYDGAVPSGISAAVGVLARLAEFSGDEALREKARKAIAPFVDRMRKVPMAQPEMLRHAAFLFRSPREIVVSGKPGDAGFEALCTAARRTWSPYRVLAFAQGTAGEEKDIPLLEGRAPAAKAAAYVCRDRVCKAPVSTPADLEASIKER